ncbi:MAG: hypothetical protein LBL34_04945 [Clostridiales bacterium]|jgi:hypothetical protein|nr:hypothetical protein [Clostridiales bacterium]
MDKLTKNGIRSSTNFLLFMIKQIFKHFITFALGLPIYWVTYGLLSYMRASGWLGAVLQHRPSDELSAILYYPLAFTMKILIEILGGIIWISLPIAILIILWLKKRIKAKRNCLWFISLSILAGITDAFLVVPYSYITGVIWISSAIPLLCEIRTELRKC